MRKNVASQVIGAQMITASDGSVFSGSVTCYVTGDGGTQAAGAVGSGACTHEGNGFHTYTPAQAETNYDHVAFTFTGTGAIAATVQVYPSFPQTGDNFARLGAPAGASVSADVAAMKVDTAAILADTGTDGVVVAAGSKTGYSLTATTGLGNQTADITGNLSGSVGSVTGAVGSVTGNVGGNVAGSVGSVTGAVGSVTGAVGSVTAGVTVTTNSDKTGYRLSATGVDDVLDEVYEGTTTLRQFLRLAASSLWGKLSGAATTAIAIRDEADTKDRITATVDADGNRSAVTLDKS